MVMVVENDAGSRACSTDVTAAFHQLLLVVQAHARRQSTLIGVSLTYKLALEQ
jgi:hypothetical protein